MNQRIWSNVDSYIVERLNTTDAILESALIASDAAGLPQYAVSPNQGKFLHLLVQMQGASRVLEIGTLGGYSTIWLARAVVKGGSVTTLEVDPTHAAVAKSNIENAGLSHVVDVRLGRASETLSQLVAAGVPPFDFIFIDADKSSTPEYLDWSLKLSRPGTVIVCDNVIRDGEVVNPNSQDASVIGVRAFIDLMAGDPRLSATAIQTVGFKGYDGFSLAIVHD